jgi:NAD(P)-dependent dehydrogenase (short-subunit alcohol dehydrogenase family)
MIWFITGASRGIGAAIAREALSRGHKVAATARDVESLRGVPGLLPLTADVTDEQSLIDAVDATVEHFGRIDVLVNNAARPALRSRGGVRQSRARRLRRERLRRSQHP